MAFVAVNHNTMPKDNKTTGGHMSPRLKAAMERTGNLSNYKNLKRTVQEVARNLLFPKAKFLMPADLAAGGKVSRMVRKSIGNGKYDRKEWEGIWEDWAKRVVANAVSSKRNTVTQTIMKNMMKGKFSHHLCSLVISPHIVLTHTS